MIQQRLLNTNLWTLQLSTRARSYQHLQQKKQKGADLTTDWKHLRGVQERQEMENPHEDVPQEARENRVRPLLNHSQRKPLHCTQSKNQSPNLQLRS
jgi:hypothetical protein